VKLASSCCYWVIYCFTHIHQHIHLHYYSAPSSTGAALTWSELLCRLLGTVPVLSWMLPLTKVRVSVVDGGTGGRRLTTEVQRTYHDWDQALHHVRGSRLIVTVHIKDGEGGWSELNTPNLLRENDVIRVMYGPAGVENA